MTPNTVALPRGEEKAKDAVRAKLRDPDSARFQNVVSDGDYICGEYNAKNGYGAYGGFDVFSYSRTKKSAVLGQAKCLETLINQVHRINEQLSEEIEAKKAAAGH